MLSGPSDDIIQVDELDVNGKHVVLELCSRDLQLDHTIFLGKSHIMLALCHNLKAADYAQNYAGIIFSSLLITPHRQLSRSSEPHQITGLYCMIELQIHILHLCHIRLVMY